MAVINKSGIEGPTFKANAKDSKKNLRPRTDFSKKDPLEAKAKDRNGRGEGQKTRTQFF